MVLLSSGLGAFYSRRSRIGPARFTTETQRHRGRFLNPGVSTAVPGTLNLNARTHHSFTAKTAKNAKNIAPGITF